MRDADEMRVEVVHVGALLPAAVAAPGVAVVVAVAVEALVEEIQRLVGEHDAAVDAAPAGVERDLCLLGLIERIKRFSLA